MAAGSPYGPFTAPAPGVQTVPLCVGEGGAKGEPPCLPSGDADGDGAGPWIPWRRLARPQGGTCWTEGGHPARVSRAGFLGLT